MSSPTGIESQFAFILFEWMIIIAAAWLVGRAGRIIGQPLAVAEIFAGLLLGPSVLGLFWPKTWPVLFPPDTAPSLQLLGRIGVVLLLFQVGMEFDFSHLRSRSRTVLAVSLTGIAAPALAGLLIGGWLHARFAPETNPVTFQCFVSIALSITALPVLARILLEMKLERTPLGVLAISASAIDDAAGWIGLAAVTALAKASFAWFPLLLHAAGLIALFYALRRGVGPALRWFWSRTQKANGQGHAQGWSSPDGGCVGVGDQPQRAGIDQSAAADAPQPPAVRPVPANGDAVRISSGFLATLLAGLFLSCIAASKLGSFSFFGAFLFGVALHEQTDLAKAWREQFGGFVMVALVPVFFTSTGLRTDIGLLNTGVEWIACGLIFAVAAGGKLAGCWLAARLTGLSPRDSMGMAALMNTRGLMGLVAINIGAELGLLPRELFTMFVLMALLTTAMTTPMVRWAGLNNQ